MPPQGSLRACRGKTHALSVSSRLTNNETPASTPKETSSEVGAALNLRSGFSDFWSAWTVAVNDVGTGGRPCAGWRPCLGRGGAGVGGCALPLIVSLGTGVVAVVFSATVFPFT